MSIHWPMSEENVGRDGPKELGHLPYPGLVQLGRTIRLAREQGFGTHDLAGRLRLSAPNPGRLFIGFSPNPSFAAGEINDRHGVAELGVPGQGARTARLRIV